MEKISGNATSERQNGNSASKEVVLVRARESTGCVCQTVLLEGNGDLFFHHSSCNRESGSDSSVDIIDALLLHAIHFYIQNC